MQLCVTAAQGRPTSLWAFGAGGKFADSWPANNKTIVLFWRKISTKHHFNTVFQKCIHQTKECFSQVKDLSPAYKNKEGGMFWENSIETCILSIVKQITSPGWMHETSARAWCPGKTQRDRVEREVGGGIGMGKSCNSMADSCQCMTKTTTIL